MKPTKNVPYTELKTGDIVRFYGARFEIETTEIKEETDPKYQENGPLMRASGKWIDGEEIGGYFGKKKPYWMFQGNKLAIASIEI